MWLTYLGRPKIRLVFPLEMFIHSSNYRPETLDVLDLGTF